MASPRTSQCRLQQASRMHIYIASAVFNSTCLSPLLHRQGQLASFISTEQRPSMVMPPLTSMFAPTVCNPHTPVVAGLLATASINLILEIVPHFDHLACHCPHMCCCQQLTEAVGDAHKLITTKIVLTASIIYICTKASTSWLLPVIYSSVSPLSAPSPHLSHCWYSHDRLN